MEWLIIAVLVMLLLLGIVFFAVKKKKPMDYYNLFTIGIIWTIIGIPLKNYILSALGLIFMIVGIVNKKRWKETHKPWNKLPKKERKYKLILIGTLSVLVLLGLVAYYYSV